MSCRQNVSYVICEQGRLRSDCACAQSNQRLPFSRAPLIDTGESENGKMSDTSEPALRLILTFLQYEFDVWHLFSRRLSIIKSKCPWLCDIAV